MVDFEEEILKIINKCDREIDNNKRLVAQMTEWYPKAAMQNINGTLEWVKKDLVKILHRTDINNGTNDSGLGDYKR